MKKKMFLVFLIFVSFIGYSYLGKKNTNSLVEEKKDNVYEFYTQLEQSGKSIEGDNYYLIGYDGKGPSSVPSRYILQEDYQIRGRSLGIIDESGEHVLQLDVDRFLYHVYSIRNREKIKSLDIKQIFQNNCPDLQLISLSSYHVRPYENEPCILFELEERPESFEDGGKDSFKRAYLNIETEELKIINYSSEQWNTVKKLRSEWGRKGYVLSDPEYSLLELNGIKEAGISYLNYWDGVCAIYLPLHRLPTENERLYKMFPQLKQNVKEEKEKHPSIVHEALYVEIYLVNYPTPEEVMRLLLPEGQEISFEGMRISGRRSIDGEVHEISSFEEYQKYLKPIEFPVDELEIHSYFKSDEL